MSDVDRIRALHAAGHLSDAEAERLIAVLSELDDSARGDGGAGDGAGDGGAGDATAADATAGDATAADADPIAVRPTPPPHPAQPPAPPALDGDADDLDLAPHTTHWCHVDLAAGDLRVVVGDVDEPRLAGAGAAVVEIDRRDDGWWIRGPRLRGLLSAWRRDATDLTLTLPRTWALSVTLKAGDVDIRGVGWVRVRQAVGDLEVEGARAIDLSLGVGDLDVDATLGEGRHRVRAKVGDVTVRLHPGSDAHVRAAVTIGRLQAPALTRESRALGARADGRCGRGTADLAIDLATGDLTVLLPEGATP